MICSKIKTKELLVNLFNWGKKNNTEEVVTLEKKDEDKNKLWTKSTDPNRPDFSWLNADSITFLNRGYLVGNISPEERLRAICDHAEKLLDIKGYANKLYRYLARGYISLSSPIWSNYGLERGSPISCFGSYIEDSVAGILSTSSEVGMMTKIGGGTSGYFGKIRPRGSDITNNGKSDGTFNFASLFNKMIDVISQGSHRRGQFAGYIDINHPDVNEWLNIQREGCEIQDMFWGVCVNNQWLKEMEEGDITKRDLWAKVLKSRIEVGIPYIFFTDNANENKPEVYKDKGYHISHSNLCNEISLPSSPDESFVCCLSSLNLLYFDEWKDTDVVETLVYFLDTVLTDFIKKSKHIPYMEKAVRFSERHRAIGVGVLGFHSYLQHKRIAFGSMDSHYVNNEVFKFISDKTKEASRSLAKLLGKPDMLKEDKYDLRHTALMSIAPTKSSSFIHGAVSPSIEPYTSNYYIKDLAKIKVVFKNPFLQELLKEKGMDTDEVWSNILINEGSVANLNGLTDEEKAIFKTFSEVSQSSVISLAAQRQQYIDQGQSLNLMIHPDTPTKDINKIHLLAAKLGVKGLYYQKSFNAAQTYNRKQMVECVACES